MQWWCWMPNHCLSLPWFHIYYRKQNQEPCRSFHLFLVSFSFVMWCCTFPTGIFIVLHWKIIFHLIYCRLDLAKRKSTRPAGWLANSLMQGLLGIRYLDDANTDQCLALLLAKIQSVHPKYDQTLGRRFGLEKLTRNGRANQSINLFAWLTYLEG